MALFSRHVPQESRAADKVYELISGHPDGVTFKELILIYQDQLKNRDSVWAAIDLLREEGNLTSNEPWQGEGYLESVKLYANRSHR